jgi:hypothetical protein
MVDRAAPETKGAPACRPRLLVVKLADFGDALLATPGISHLRAALPEARLDALCGAAGAIAFRHAGLLDTVTVLPRGAAARVSLVHRLRREAYDGLVYLHSLVTARGALKHRLLAAGLGAPVCVGLAPPATWRGDFLSHSVPDPGYGACHVVESFEAVAAMALAVFRGRDSDPVTVEQRLLRFHPGPQAETAAAKLAESLAAARQLGRPASGWWCFQPGPLLAGRTLCRTRRNSGRARSRGGPDRPRRRRNARGQGPLPSAGPGPDRRLRPSDARCPHAPLPSPDHQRQRCHAPRGGDGYAGHRHLRTFQRSRVGTVGSRGWRRRSSSPSRGDAGRSCLPTLLLYRPPFGRARRLPDA